MRHKEINAIRMHASIKFAADFALGMVTEKLRSRIKFYVSLETAKTIDRSILPLEYGGSMPMAEMIGKDFLENGKPLQTLLIFACLVFYRFVESRSHRKPIHAENQ